MTETNSKAAQRILALVEDQASFIADSSEQEFLSIFDEQYAVSELGNAARNNLEASLKAFKKKRLAQAREGARRSQDEAKRTRIIPKSAEERRSLFETILGRDDLPGDMTLAFRERRGRLSDSEIESALEDLEELGLFDSDWDGKGRDS